MLAWLRKFLRGGTPEPSTERPAGLEAVSRREAALDDPAADSAGVDSLEADLPPDLEQGVVVPIEDFIDLHTFLPKETASVVEEYLLEAHARGFREVRIIHGRGKGVQRRIVRKVLANHPLVESFADAPPQRGGWGATIARLRPGDGSAAAGGVVGDR